MHKGREDLSEQDIDNIQAFKLRMVSNMPRESFLQMRYTFRVSTQARY